MKRFMNATAGMAVALGMVLASVAPAADAVIVGCAVDSCPQACGKTVCQPTCVKTTVTTRHFTDRTEEFCLPCTAFQCLFPSKCGCSHVKTRKLLILKLHKCEKCEQKCVPVQVPVCKPACCAPACSAPCASGAPSAPAYLMESPAPTVISIPTMPAVMPSGK